MAVDALNSLDGLFGAFILDSIHWCQRLELDSAQLWHHLPLTVRPPISSPDTSTIKTHGIDEEHREAEDPVFGCASRYGFQSTSGPEAHPDGDEGGKDDDHGKWEDQTSTRHDWL